MILNNTCTHTYADASSQVKVLWYRTSTQSLDKCRYLKVRLEDARDVTHKIVIACHPIRMIFSIRVQWIYNFQFPFQQKTCLFCLCNERSSVIGSIWYLWNHQIETKLLVATFVKGLCRGTISLYLDVWSWCWWHYITISSDNNAHH